MPKFEIPEIPKELTESYWSKRELLARKVKTGVSAAIEELKQAYKKAPWKDFETLFGVQIPPNMGTFDHCKGVGKAITGLFAQFKLLIKDTQSGNIYKLKLAAWKLRDTAGKAAASLKKENKYPVAAKLAAEIAQTADFYAVSVNANSLSSQASRAYDDIIAPLDKNIRAALGMGSISGSAAALLQQLQVIRAEPDPKKRAELLTKTTLGGTNKYTTRALNQNMGARMKAAYLGCGYAGLSTAEKLFPLISKWAGSPPAVTDKNVDAAIAEIEKLAKAAQSLPDSVKYLAEK